MSRPKGHSLTCRKCGSYLGHAWRSGGLSADWWAEQMFQDHTCAPTEPSPDTVEQNKPVTAARTRQADTALYATVRHLGRAMAALERSGHADDAALREVARSIGQASDRLIDVLENTGART